jgi:hypothetical protein
MTPAEKITVTKVGADTVYTNETGESYTIRGRGEGPGLEIDPRIDLTKPIYEQVMKLAAKDRAKRRKRPAAAA